MAEDLYDKVKPGKGGGHDGGQGGAGWGPISTKIGCPRCSNEDVELIACGGGGTGSDSTGHSYQENIYNCDKCKSKIEVRVRYDSINS